MKKVVLSNIICYLLLAICYLLSACDYITQPLLPHSGINGNNKISVPDSVGYQNVLIEDYTGMACINCPTMASRAEELIAQYGSRVILMEVNYGYFADPLDWAAPYNVWDAETTVGDAYGNMFVSSSAGFPYAMVNRQNVPQNTQQLPDSSTMGSAAIAVINQNTGKPNIYIDILKSYNSATSVLTVTVNTFFLKAVTGNYNLTVLLTQDSIIAPQNDKPSPIASFAHRFALRDNITGSPWGDNILNGSDTANQVVSKIYTYTIKPSYQSPDSNKPPLTSNYQQSYVVAFVYDALTTSPTQYQVMQVQQKRIYP